jgi:ubiquitin carboxyl-terminal hydrolase 8
VTGETIEDSLSVAPRDEWVLFCNRDKFDLIAIYDDASETPGPPDAPLAKLIRAIYETAFRKILKRVPVLLVGGLEAWKREFGDQELVVEQAPVAPMLYTPALLLRAGVHVVAYLGFLVGLGMLFTGLSV